MKIALLVSGIMEQNYESLTITTLGLAKELAQQANDVVVITRKKNDAPTIEKKDGITFYRIENIGRFALYNKLLSFPFALRRMAKKKQFSFNACRCKTTMNSKKEKTIGQRQK